MSVRNPRQYDGPSPRTLTPGATYATQCGGRVTYRDTIEQNDRRGFSVDVAVFDVERESDEIHGPTYSTTEFLAVTHVEAGDWVRVN